MKKTILFFIVILLVHNVDAQSSWTETVYSPMKSTVTDIVATATDGFYFRDEADDHFVMDDISVEEVSASNSVDGVFGSVPINGKDYQIYYDGWNQKLMADSVQITDFIWISDDDYLGFYHDPISARTVVAAGISSLTGNTIHYVVFDNNFNILFIGYDPDSSFPCYIDLAVVDDENIVAIGENGDTQHLHFDYQMNTVTKLNYNVDRGNILDLAVYTDNTLVIVSETKGINFTELSASGSYVWVDSHFPTFDTGVHIDLKFADRNCDGDLDVLTRNRITGELTVQESTFSQHGSHEYISETLGIFNAGNYHPFNWINSNGDGPLEIAVSDSKDISVFTHSETVCGSTASLSLIPDATYDGPVHIFDLMGRTVYVGDMPQSPETFGKQAGWNSGIYVIKQSDSGTYITKFSVN